MKLGEKLATLIKRDGMREHGADRGELNAGRGDEVVANLQKAFGVDAHRIGEQQIVMLGDGAVQRVFNGEHGALRRGPRAVRRNVSVDTAQGRTSQSGASSSAAMWLLEPRSPWMATRRRDGAGVAAELSRHDVLFGRSGVGSLIADISIRLGQPQHNPTQLTLANAAETASSK